MNMPPFESAADRTTDVADDTPVALDAPVDDEMLQTQARLREEMLTSLTIDD